MRLRPYRITRHRPCPIMRLRLSPITRRRLHLITPRRQASRLIEVSCPGGVTPRFATMVRVITTPDIADWILRARIDEAVSWIRARVFDRRNSASLIEYFYSLIPA